MAAPSHTNRSTPVGIKMDDGHSTKIAFALDPDISFWEKTVTPPGLDGGDPIETKTMHNTRWRTKSPKALVDMTEVSATVAWDPAVYTQILAILNVEGSITVHFPDGSKYTFYGFLQKFEPGEHQEGEQPEATVTICPTNQDPTTGAEEGPVLVSVAGT